MSSRGIWGGCGCPKTAWFCWETPLGWGHYSIQSQLWGSGNSLSSGPWALLVPLLQESFGVILDDPFAAQFPPWMPLPFLNTLFFPCFSLSPDRLPPRLRGTMAGFSSELGLDPLFPMWVLGSSGFLLDQRCSLRAPHLSLNPAQRQNAGINAANNQPRALKHSTA